MPIFPGSNLDADIYFHVDFFFRSVNHSSAKPIQMKSSMSFLRRNRYKPIDICILKKDGGLDDCVLALKRNYMVQSEYKLYQKYVTFHFSKLSFITEIHV